MVKRDGVILEKNSLMVKRDGVILEERYSNEEQNKIKPHRKICVISEIRVPLIPQTAQV